MRYVQEKAKDERPFFIYWATYTQQLQGPLSALSLVQFATTVQARSILKL